MSAEEIIDALQLIMSANLGPITYKLLCKALGSPGKVINYLSSNKYKSVKLCPREEAIQQWEKCQSMGVLIITEKNPFYPSKLKIIEDSSPILFGKGQCPNLLQSSSLAIVGARFPATYSMEIARTITEKISLQGITVISGMAVGIDKIAHEYSMKTGTIAVLAGGIDDIYPESNHQLYNSILSNGFIISSMPCGKKASAFLFPSRNKIIAGISYGVLVIEASEKSGSLMTANFARSYKKPVWAIPGHPLDSRFTGSNQLLKSGANIADDGENIISFMQQLECHDYYQPQSPYPPISIIENYSDEEEKIILSVLGKIPTPIETIAVETNLPIEKVMGIALMMSLEGKVTFHAFAKISLV